MPVSDTDIRSFCDDYAAITGKSTDQFICPVSLTKIPVSGLIHGHILSKAFNQSDRRTILQHSAFDHFYGSHAEPEAIRYLNLRGKSEFELLRSSKRIRIEFGDKSEADAFAPKPRALRQLANRYAVKDFPTHDGIVTLCIKVPPDDNRLSDIRHIHTELEYFLYGWVASMVKAAYLCSFAMLGYRAVFDPLSDTIRRSLLGYFQDGASDESAHRYFSDLGNSVKIVGHGRDIETFQSNYEALGFDTLKDEIVVLHYSRDMALFAMTTVFRINGLTVSVTLPQSDSNTNAVKALMTYYAVINDRSHSDYVSHRAQFRSVRWEVERNSTRVILI